MGERIDSPVKGARIYAYTVGSILWKLDFTPQSAILLIYRLYFYRNCKFELRKLDN